MGYNYRYRGYVELSTCELLGATMAKVGRLNWLWGSFLSSSMAEVIEEVGREEKGNDGMGNSGCNNSRKAPREWAFRRIKGV